MNRTTSMTGAVSAACLLMACASASVPPPNGTDDASVAEPAVERTVDTSNTNGAADLVEPGHGTLRQDAFTMTLRDEALLIKVTPLAESVTRLAAPDTYRRLHGLATSRLQAAREAADSDQPELFLVSFFSYDQDTSYSPEDIQLRHQGQLLQAEDMLPVTGGWGRQRLHQQETQSAVYVFEGPIDLAQPLIVQYNVSQSDDWARIIPVLERERSKVRGRSSRAPAVRLQVADSR